MLRGRCWLALVACFMLQWSLFDCRKIATCQQVCSSLGVPDGCKYAADSGEREEVIVITNGTSDIKAWKWETITMVVSAYFSSTRTTGLTACYTHSMGRRYGLRELVPDDLQRLVSDTDGVKSNFTNMILTYQSLFMADHIVYDLLGFFANLEGADPSVNKSVVLCKMGEVLSNAMEEVRKRHNRETYCIVPWEPPCKSDCGDVRALLSECDFLLMSPDSYIPVAPADKDCLAQATVPITQFLYGIDRYISLKTSSRGPASIVAGIPWHGYVYKCDHTISDDKCKIQQTAGEACFSNKNRQRMSLSDIHSLSLSTVNVKMDVLTKGLYCNLNNTAQLWFENFTTLLIKYQLVSDLELKGLSLWYGEDLTFGMSEDSAKFSSNSWSFLIHHVLHRTAYTPHTVNHFYADTVAGVGVGCLLLGTILGVTFACIAFRRNSFQKLNRPFKLDEDENAFRDDEGL
ncbi:di-N-acetylchitobiase-like [Babylonia areolata]|uniref:di-N-acetylchitobiase-like n=1 Tax=Babylonia areolata TaxID=304850 RepID=UPI003FD59596